MANNGRRDKAAGALATERRTAVSRRAVVMVGMRRSGTSTVAHAISLLGADLPRTLRPVASDNAMGDWESLKLVRLHDELLAAASTSWHDLADPRPAWLQSSAVEDLRERAADLLRQEYGNSPLFVFRDPRICRTIPFWLPVFSKLDISPRFVIAVRNPLEVTASLKARDDIPEARGLLLWLKYMIDVERETRGQPRVFVRYADFISDWAAACEEVGSRLEIEWPNPIPKAAKGIELFLSKASRDFQFPDSELRSRPDIAQELKDAYRAINTAASSRAEPDSATLDAAGAWLDGARRALDPQAATALPKRDGKVADAERSARAGHAPQTGEEDLEELRAQIQSLERELSKERRGRKRSKATATQRLNELNAAKQRVAELEAAVDASRQEASSLEMRLTAAAREQRRLRTTLVARQMTIDRERSERAKLSEELDAREGLREAISVRDARLAQQQLTLQAFESSTSWRMTGPFRWIKRVILRRPSLQEELLQGGEGSDSARP